jgi:hypothetical protein
MNIFIKRVGKYIYMKRVSLAFARYAMKRGFVVIVSS